MRLQQVITVVGVHAEGEVGRVITGGVIAPRARSMFECQQSLQRDQDWLRGMLLSDPARQRQRCGKPGHAADRRGG